MTNLKYLISLVLGPQMDLVMLVIKLFTVVIRSLIHIELDWISLLKILVLLLFSMVLGPETDLGTLIISIWFVVIRSLIHIELDWISLLREM